MSSSSESIELARLKRSRYWREEDGRTAVEAWRRSGLSLAAFTRQHGLSETRVRWWRERLGRRAPLPLTPAALVPVTIVRTAVPAAEAAARMEVVLSTGRVLRVRDDFDTEALVKLVRVLESSC